MKFFGIYAVQHRAPGVFGPHTHERYEFVYCVEGNGRVETEAGKKPFRTGSYYVVRPGEIHTELDDNPCRIIYFYLDAQDVPTGVFADHDGAVLSAVRKLLRESQANFREQQEMQLCLLRQILILVRRTASGENEADFAAVMQYVNENLEQEIDFRQLAKKQGYSYDRFRHLFRAHTGVSPHRYVNLARIEKAKFLMSMGPGITISDIAMSCGFHSPSQFTNIFRAHTGRAPSDYRKGGE